MTALPGAGLRCIEAGITRRDIAWTAAGICLLSAMAISVPLFADYLAAIDAAGSVAPAALAVKVIPVDENKHLRDTGSIAGPEVVAVSTAGETGRNSDSRPPGDANTAETIETIDTAVTADTAKTIKTADTAKTAETAETIETAALHSKGDDSEQSHIGITLLAPTSAPQLARAYRNAATAAAAGDHRNAIDKLEHILASDSNHHAARLLLANLLIRQQRNANAESILVSGLAQHPLHTPYAHLLARMLVAEGRNNEAIEWLQSALPGATRDAEYHALLAGLYQRNGEPAAAAGYYSTALDISPGRGEWWMGLGIAQEQAGHSGDARAAYRQAMRFPLANTLQDYINDRLQRLTDDVSLNETNRQLPGKD